MSGVTGLSPVLLRQEVSGTMDVVLNCVEEATLSCRLQVAQGRGSVASPNRMIAFYIVLAVSCITLETSLISRRVQTIRE